ncbi:MAG TPA: helical backbone metal receptor [Candidatus Dormibacteraeota bacterium]|nr:helical backbone metal receptor [Candidatus Dormibacteraeota bacterium]
MLAAVAALLLAPMVHAAPPLARATRAVTDEMGRRIEVPVQVRRVVSLAPNVTDILYSIGAGARIAGVTDFTATPPGAAPKPNVGEPLEPSLERIVALKPDLVFASRTINRQETVESLEQLGIPVYVTDAHSVEDMLNSVRRVADLVGMGPAGEGLAARLEKRLEALRARLAGRPIKRVLFVVWEDPLITTGEHTFIADALRWAGARSVVRLQQDWPRLSLEEVVHLQPDDLIFPATSSGAVGDIARALRSRPGWRDLKAVRAGRVLLASDAINIPSPQLVDAIEQLARKLHPAAFAAAEPSPALAAGTDGR